LKSEKRRKGSKEGARGGGIASKPRFNNLAGKFRRPERVIQASKAKTDTKKRTTVKKEEEHQRKERRPQSGSEKKGTRVKEKLSIKVNKIK